jgi:hypothetical protein
VSVHLSARMEQLSSHWTDFHEIWYFGIFLNSVKKIQDFLKWDKNKGHCTWRPIYIFIISRSFLLRMRNVSDKHCRENQNTHCVFSNFFFFQISCRLWDKVEKYCRVRQATDDNMAHAHYMLDTQGYKYAHSVCVILIAFPTVTMAAWTCLNVTLYVYIACLVM